jgi:peroxiredoxin
MSPLRAIPLLTLLVLGCNPPTPTPSATSTATPAPPVATPAPASSGHPDIGQAAPDFTLPDTEGRKVHLADLKGKTVVLEWMNPGCPFVNKAHLAGSLKDAARRHAAEGVVWLGINSSAPGREGAGVEATKDAIGRFALEHPVLLDESGDVGHAYGATNTPHLFVIDPSGKLVYRGAADNSPDGEGLSPTDGKLVRYVDAALADLAAGRPVALPSTKPYGCTVKYARP